MTDREGGGGSVTSRARLRALLSAHGIRPRRSLGQTFLTDANIVRKIVATAEIGPDDPVLEIGPGAGAMTEVLARAARRVLAIEVDPALTALLRARRLENVEIVEGDVLEADWSGLLGGEGTGEWQVVANLPYAITGPAIVKLLDTQDWIARLTIMVQAEVAERLVASPGSRTRGLLSVLVQAAGEARLAFRVARTCFWPVPAVDSAVVSVAVRRPPLVPSELTSAFGAVVRGAFGARRKMIANALAQSPLLRLDKAEAEALLERCGIAPTRRAESVSVEEFLGLARAYRVERGPAE